MRIPRSYIAETEAMYNIEKGFEIDQCHFFENKLPAEEYLLKLEDAQKRLDSVSFKYPDLKKRARKLTAKIREEIGKLGNLDGYI